VIDGGTPVNLPAVEQRTYRVVVRVDGGPGEDDVARTAGELAAMQHLDAAGLGFRDLRSSATCTDDIKVRRR
jgi:hypothetical protein